MSEKIRVESTEGLCVRQWDAESVAVVFNPSSGNTFEVNEVTVRLIDALSRSALSLAEAFDVSGLVYDGLEQEAALNRFRKQYLEPLHQLDVLRIRFL